MYILEGGIIMPNIGKLIEVDVRELRANALYSIDEKSTIRKSHENPTIKKIYEEYLEKPGSYRSEKLLHTTYMEREKYKLEK